MYRIREKSDVSDKGKIQMYQIKGKSRCIR